MQVTLCDPYLSALDAFAWTRGRAIQIDVYFTLLLYFSGMIKTLDPRRVQGLNHWLGSRGAKPLEVESIVSFKFGCFSKLLSGIN